jgi:hypothetical protein
LNQVCKYRWVGVLLLIILDLISFELLRKPSCGYVTLFFIFVKTSVSKEFYNKYAPNEQKDTSIKVNNLNFRWHLSMIQWRVEVKMIILILRSLFQFSVNRRKKFILFQFIEKTNCQFKKKKNNNQPWFASLHKNNRLFKKKHKI